MKNAGSNNSVSATTKFAAIFAQANVARASSGTGVNGSSMFASSSSTMNAGKKNGSQQQKQLRKTATNTGNQQNQQSQPTNSTTLLEQQLQCVERLQDCVDRVLECKRRDMHLKTLQQCIATFTDDADKDEPLTADSFAVYDCFRFYTQEIVYFPEKFDFIILCIMHRICVVTKPRQFHQMLDDLLQPATTALAQRIGGELLTRLIEEDAMKDDDEMARVEAFCLKKDWIPTYSMNSPLKFLRDQEEQKRKEEAEKQKRILAAANAQQQPMRAGRRESAQTQNTKSSISTSSHTPQQHHIVGSSSLLGQNNKW